MSWETVKLKPGVNVELTSTALEAGYATSAFIRFRAGMAEKLGGWQKYVPSAVPGVPLHSHAWEDLAQDARLAVGSTSAVQDITNSIVTTITPQTFLTNSTLNFSTTLGSATVTVVDTNVDGLTVTDAVFFNTPVSIGGIVLSGLYPIASIVSTTSYTVVASANATANASNAGTIPAFTTTSGLFTVNVTLANHGLTLGGDIVFPISSTLGGCIILGRYIAQSIIDGNNFTINASQAATSSAGPTAMNSGNGQLLYYISIGPSTPSLTTTVFKTAVGGGSFTVPATVYSLTAQAIGGGVAGGGAYALATPLAVTPGQTVYYNVGAAGADSWINTSANAAPTLSSQGVLAKAAAASGIMGGQAASCVGTLLYSGGNGGSNGFNPGTYGGYGGGGGAAGPNGAGKNGGNGSNGSAAGPVYVVFVERVGAGAWTVPSGVTSLTLEAVGGGGLGYKAGSSAYGGGGGGAYSKTNTITVTPGQTVYFSVGTSADSWINISASSAPGSTAAGVLAKAGASSTGTAGGAGGAAASGIGNVTYSGGNGGTGDSSGYYPGGGGGAAGPNGAGKNGGNGFTSNGCGGGGGSNGGSSSAGANGTSTAGGNGGNGTSGSGGGAGATTLDGYPTNGTGGGGGGGGFGLNGNNVASQGGTDGSLAGGAYGVGGGGGGGVFGDASGGAYGGGGGGWSYSETATTGIAVITYTVPAVYGANGGGGGANGGSSTAGADASGITGGNGGEGTGGTGAGAGSATNGTAGTAGGGGGGGTYNGTSGAGGSDTSLDSSHGAGGGGGGNASGALYGGGGTAGGAQGIVAYSYTTTYPAQPGTAISATDYTLDNWGSFLTACPAAGPLFYWDPASGFANMSIIASAPPFSTGAFVSISAQQIIAYGSSVNADIGVYQDPLMVRWCNVGDFTDWTTLVTNQAGSYRLTSGSRIVGGFAGPSATNYLWTDLALWQMQYIGSGLVYGFTKVADNCGLIAKHAFAALGTDVFWMTPGQFFTMSAGGVQPMVCPVRDAVFQNINRSYTNSCFAGANTSFNEVWFFWPSAASTGYCDMAVKHNKIENTWDIVPLQRNTWIDVSVIPNPIATNSSGVVYAQESGQDADTVAMTPSFTTGYFTFNEGEDIMFVDRVYPDFKWGTYGTSGASIQITVYTAKYPGSTPVAYGPFTVTQATPYISKRMRGRFFALGVSGADAGSFWRLGAVKFRAAPDGRGV